MSDNNFNYDDEPGFFAKYRFVIMGIVVVAIVGGVIASLYLFKGTIPPPRKPEQITISLPPPPPPPTPPPPPPPPKTPPPPKMEVVTPSKPNDPKPKDNLKAVAKAPGNPGPKGPASPDGTVAGGSGGDGSGDIGGGGGDIKAWYAARVKDAVQHALTSNNQTRSASIHHLKIRLWIDENGRVTRTTLSGTSGDSTVDDALKNQAFANLQMSDPPPAGVPMPVNMYIDAVRPQ